MFRALPLALVAFALVCLSVLSQEQEKDKEKEKNEGPRVATTSAEFLESYTKYELLMYYPTVHEELGLKPSQVERLRKVQGKLSRFIEEQKKSVQQLPPPENDLVKAQRRLNIRLTRKSYQLGIEAEMLKVLDRDQRRRLDEILLQAEGPVAFLRPEVQERLNMAPDQTLRIQEIVAQAREAAEQTRGWGRDLDKYVRKDPDQPGKFQIDPDHVKDVNAGMTKRHQERLSIRKSVYGASAKILTKRQRALYSKMCGKPFDIETLHHLVSPLLGSNVQPKSREESKPKQEAKSKR